MQEVNMMGGFVCACCFCLLLDGAFPERTTERCKMYAFMQRKHGGRTKMIKWSTVEFLTTWCDSLSSLLGCSSVAQRHIFCTLSLVFVVTSHRFVLRTASLCSVKGQADSWPAVIQHETSHRVFFWNIHRHRRLLPVLSCRPQRARRSGWTEFSPRREGSHASRVCLRASHLLFSL